MNIALKLEQGEHYFNTNPVRTYETPKHNIGLENINLV